MIDLFENLDSIKFGQYHACPHPSGTGYIVDVPHGQLIYIPQFIEPRIADRTLEVFFANAKYDWEKTNWHEITAIEHIAWQNIAWQQDTVKMYGKEHLLPRISAWYGDTGKSYKYSGILLHPKPWTPALLWIKQHLQTISDQPYNSVLLNWYRSGQDYISWHTDAEKELGENPTIASINFGESRRFLLRRNDDHNDKIEIILNHGDLLIMQGALQHHWQHSVPKQAKVSHGRLNMTFRSIQ